jgi:hypothetical protein
VAEAVVLLVLVSPELVAAALEAVVAQLVAVAAVVEQAPAEEAQVLPLSAPPLLLELL